MYTHLYLTTNEMISFTTKHLSHLNMGLVFKPLSGKISERKSVGKITHVAL